MLSNLESVFFIPYLYLNFTKFKNVKSFKAAVNSSTCVEAVQAHMAVMFINITLVVLKVMCMEMVLSLSQWVIYHCQEEIHQSICQELMELIS